MRNEIVIKEAVIPFDEKALENLVACKKLSNYELHFRLYRISKTELKIDYVSVKKDQTSLKRPRTRHSDVLEICEAVMEKLEGKYKNEIIYYDFR